MVTKKQVIGGIVLLGIILLIVGLSRAGLNQSFSVTTPTLTAQKIAIPKYTNIVCQETQTIPLVDELISDRTVIQLPGSQIKGHPVTCGANRASCRIEKIIATRTEVYGGLTTNLRPKALVISKRGTDRILSMDEVSKSIEGDNVIIDTTGLIGDLSSGETITAGLFGLDFITGFDIEPNEVHYDVIAKPVNVRRTDRAKQLQIITSSGFLSISSLDVGCNLNRVLEGGGLRAGLVVSTDDPDGQSENTCTLTTCGVGGAANIVEGFQLVDLLVNRPLVWQGKTAFCQLTAQGARIYDLKNLQYRDTQSPNAVQTVQYPDQQIATTQCCPGQDTLEFECSDDGKIIPRITPKQCISDLECGVTPVFLPDKPKELCTLGCSGNVCQVDSCRATECSPTAPCASGVCDLVSGKCVSGGSAPVLPPEKQCKEGEKLVVKETKTCEGRVLCELGITNPTTSSVTECKETSLLEQYGLLILIIFGALLIVGSLVGTNPQVMKSLKRRKR